MGCAAIKYEKTKKNPLKTCCGNCKYWIETNLMKRFRLIDMGECQMWDKMPKGRSITPRDSFCEMFEKSKKAKIRDD